MKSLKQKLFKNKKIILIILLALLLRIWKVGSIPPGLTPDEAALGYNAYSILKTGRDEYGKIFPIIFKSFGDFKPGLYVYLSVPFVAFFGLSEFSVRMPSVLSGVLAVYLLYKIVEIFSKRKFSHFALLTAFLLAISPWHIHFSRGAWEANVALSFILGGIYFFLHSFANKRMLFISALLFGLSVLTYQGAKLSALLVVITLFVVFWGELIELGFKRLFISGLIGLLISLPIIFSILNSQVGRLNVFSVFSYPRPERYLNDFLIQGDEDVGEISYYLFHSESLNFARGIAGRWFNHFSGRFLFFDGDWQNPRHSSPGHGLLLISDLIFLPLGVIELFRKKTKLSAFFALWLIISPLPSALSRDQVHAVRALSMSVPLAVVSAYGISLFLEKRDYIKNKFLRGLNIFFIIIMISGAFVYFFDSYFTHLPQKYSHLWGYGYKDIVETIRPISGNYEKIYVQQSFSQPYIYFLFYNKYDPGKYHKQAILLESEYKGDVGYIEELDNICFCAINWSLTREKRGSLFVGDSINIPKSTLNDENVKLIKEVKYLNGDTAFYVVEISQ